MDGHQSDQPREGHDTAARLEASIVLIVDDDPDIVTFVREALEMEGYATLAAVDEAALHLAHEAQPDVILLDIMMPHMDGIEVSQRLRADPATADIPIVAMSAVGNLRELGRTMAADDRLAKPFHFGDLFAVVARWTTRQPLDAGQG